MNKPVVAIVHLGRAGGMGGLRRVQSLLGVFTEAGAEVHEVALRRDHRPRPQDVLDLPVADLVRGAAVPEALAWSSRSARASLDRIRPDVVICETARAYHPRLAAGSWRLVVDYVDRLSVSYRYRAQIVSSRAHQALFTCLGWASRRFESRPLPAGTETLAAGWADAAALGATWVPITFEPLQLPELPITHDVLFYGNLSYPPNVAAVERLGRLWPSFQGRRPGLRLLLAGARPVPLVHSLAERMGWSVKADFDDLLEVLGSVRLAVVPLQHATGIQTKLLEAAAAGVAQVVDPVANAGMKPGFPVAVAGDDETFVTEVIRLLDDDESRRRLGAASKAAIIQDYSTAAWAPWARTLLTGL
jgi:glycosyltransferase involved in cell wall biosynthesis